MEAQEYQPEVNFSDTLVQHLSGEFRPPEVEGPKHAKHDSTENHVVEVRNHEVSVGDVEIQRRGGKNNTGETAVQEGDQESENPQQRSFEGNRSLPHSTDPVEELHTGWNTNHHGHE